MVSRETSGGLLRALYRYARARRRQKRHARLGGVEVRCMLPDCPEPIVGTHVPLSHARDLDRAHHAIFHPEVRVARPTAVGTAELDPGLTEWRAHPDDPEGAPQPHLVRPHRLRWLGRG